jgi:hypothetical protein
MKKLFLSLIMVGALVFAQQAKATPDVTYETALNGYTGVLSYLFSGTSITQNVPPTTTYGAISIQSSYKDAYGGAILPSFFNAGQLDPNSLGTDYFLYAVYQDIIDDNNGTTASGGTFAFYETQNSYTTANLDAAGVANLDSLLNNDVTGGFGTLLFSGNVTTLNYLTGIAEGIIGGGYLATTYAPDQYMGGALEVDLNHGSNQLGAINISGKAIVNPVPEPTTMLLFGFGLIGLAGIGRRKSLK